ncbi:MtlD Mannitol-1-phosphate/altronate dehydrogenases [Rhabdaerophilaceae bacterium]
MSMSSEPRLSLATLSTLPDSVRRPTYDRGAIRPGIVHIGIGNFHRAHQAEMTDRTLAAGAMDWGIIAASLRSPETRDALAPQDGLYTLCVRDGDGARYQVIGSIGAVIVAPENPAALIDALALPSVRIVTLTVTEKGYCHLPATRSLDEAHADIVHDLANPAAPRSAIGYLAAGLARRRSLGLAPFTVLCCDNLPANGETVKRVLTRFSALLDPELGEHVARDVAFPSTMVDRIVPATTDADRALVLAALGVKDAWPVMTEPFSQWVIEDRFPQGRPAWEHAGAEFVADVAPYELMKLRLLNGAHSMLAYIGSLVGHTYVADAAADPAFVQLLKGFWEETASTLPQNAGLDIPAYTRRLMARYLNPEIRHRLAQIAMDGSQKLPQRQIATIVDLRRRGEGFAHNALAVAGFLIYMTGTRSDGSAYEVRDPLASRFKAAGAESAGDAKRLVLAALAIRDVFGRLEDDPIVIDALTNAVIRLRNSEISA